MICYPNAKINLSLAVTGQRSDGYHTLQTVFCPIGLTDALELEPASDGKDSLYLSGIQVDCPTDNLVMRALAAVRRERSVPPTAVALYKAIPTGAGLGGGSADAAFMLRLLNDRYELGLSPQELHQMAIGLGADCAFFLHNQPALAGGIGDELEHLPRLDLSGLRIVLVKPPFGISTPEAYQGLGGGREDQRAGLADGLIHALRSGDIRSALPWLVNDFEPTVFVRHPELARIKAQLMERGALAALMSGSGSTIYGIFEADAPEVDTSIWQDCFVWQGSFA